MQVQPPKVEHMSGNSPQVRSAFDKGRAVLRRLRDTRPVRYTRVAVGRFLRDDATKLAGHVAFTALLSLFPFLIVLIALAGLLGQNDGAHALIYTLLDYLPTDIVAVLRPPVENIINGAGGGVITIGLVTALWTAANVIESLRAAVNRAFGVRRPRAMWLRRIESIALVAFLALAIVIVVPILFILPAVIAPAVDFLGINHAWVTLVQVARLPLMLAAMFAVVWILFRFLPNARLRAKPLLPAAVLVVALWALAGAGFSIYLRTVATYSVVYGGLGGVIVALLFFYLLAAVFILGAYFAAVHARVHGALRRKSPRTRADARRV